MLRQLPSGAVFPDCKLYMAAGMQIQLELLQAEIERLEVRPSRLRIDRSATLITPEDIETERRVGLYDRIASTLTGTGAAIARRVLRREEVRRVADEPALSAYGCDVALELNDLVDRGVEIVVEGTQGLGLSLWHGHFPFVTGRDTTAAGFLAEAGLSPQVVDDVVVVLRTYPIRVGGPSGPLDDTSWETVAQRAGYPTALAEYTSVTGRLRRVGNFDWDLAKRAVRINRPTALAVHGIDYLDYEDLGKRHWDELGPTSRRFIAELERRLNVAVRYVFTGPAGSDLIDRGEGVELTTAARNMSRAWS
jgi:adenylosuccinate synthase